MKKSFKFNVGVKCVLAIILCLPFKVYSSADTEDYVSLFDGHKQGVDPTTAIQRLSPDPAAIPLELQLDDPLDPAAVMPTEVDSQKRVFVLACNEAYAGPTAVAIRSLMDTNCYLKIVLILAYEVTPESMQKLRNMADTFTAIYVVNLCEEQWKTMPNFREESIDLIESIKKVGKGPRFATGELDGVVFDSCQCGEELYKFMINLRFFLPEIFASGFLPADLRDIDYFLWLDSDLLVCGDLSVLWEIAEKYPHQRMFGSNLDHQINDPNCLRIVETDEVADGIYRISGGVVLWNIKQIVTDCRQIPGNVFGRILFHAASYDSYRFLSEELVFTLYSWKTLQIIAPDALFCFFPFSCNMAQPVLLQYFVVTPNSIVIFHWDSMVKPWNIGNSNIDEQLHFCPVCTNGEDGLCPLACKGNKAFIIPPGSEEGCYFLSLFPDPEEGQALLERYFPCLLKKNFTDGETPVVPTKGELLFLRQILLWKTIATRTEFYRD